MWPPNPMRPMSLPAAMSEPLHENARGRVFRRRVAGQEVETRIEPEILALTGDHDRDAADVASWLGLVAELLAEATQALEDADVEYRHWRAVASRSVLLEDPKTAEWKVKTEVETHPRFPVVKAPLAKLEADIAFLRGYHDALIAKGQMIRVRVDLVRSGLAETQPTATSRPNYEPREPRDDAAVRRQRIRDTMRRDKEE